ncbi:MAG: DUF2066 domain-containing protein [Acetobacteraceae bacterium]|nr:DUF2066 domain-containing protein [Acetobacteraceae bacterium]
MRRAVPIGLASLVAWVLLPAVSAAQPAGSPESLYRCSVIVTGTDMRGRSDAMGQCLRRVMVKVSGDPALADDPRLDHVASSAGTLAESFAYFDRMSDIPHHDEQGSRDRPYDLVVDFDPAKVDAALTAVGSAAWRTRPALVMAVRVKDRKGDDYMLSADGADGERQREALFAAADRFGLRVILLPEQDSPGRNATGPEFVARAARTVRSTPLAALTGTLVWSDADAGWVGSWHVAQDRHEGSWGIRGVSFDDAFRSAIGGAAAVLSGHRRSAG